MMNTIYHEDCLTGMQRIPDKSVDMILCDLPYGTTACKWDTIIPFEPLWEQYERIIKDNGAIVLTASQPFTSALVMSNSKLFKYSWYWEKERGTGFANAKIQPLRSVEDVLVFYKKQPTYNPQLREIAKPYKHALPIVQSDVMNAIGSTSKTGRIYKEYTHSYPVNILKIARQTKGSIHPTQKPVALFEYLIKTYTNEGDTVLDNCMGSGTTAIAALNTNRNFIGFEKDATYHALACERIARHRQQAVDLFSTPLPL